MDGSGMEREGLRRRPVGVEPTTAGGHVRVWAPGHAGVALVTPKGAEVHLAPAEEGYFAGWVDGLTDGALYGFRLDGEDVVRPDPASRCQPDGPDGWSRVVDPGLFPWTDDAWTGVTLPGQVLYELHIGTFTQAGTWEAAEAELPRLRDLGVTVIEMMPIAEFSGRFGWGYDAAALFAPSHRYGSPDDLRRFVDRAHTLGLGVILDVVYNHLGPEGCHITNYAPNFLSEVHGTDWGQGLNFDGPGSKGVRDFVLANVAHWIEEYHFDGLRLDSTQDIHDASQEHILSAIARTARKAAGHRSVILIAENEPQEARLLHRPEQGGFGLDAVWADDFHHSAIVALTGHRRAYFRDYTGGPQELLSAIRRGWLFQGQRYDWHDKQRGTSALDLRPERFVTFLENHDQIANTGLGQRLHQRTSPGQLRALTALLLLGPATPCSSKARSTQAQPRSGFLQMSVRTSERQPVRAVASRWASSPTWRPGRWPSVCQTQRRRRRSKPASSRPRAHQRRSMPLPSTVTFCGCAARTR
ncbi:Malto-oligosyltrehalose trehalohydrolase [Rubellimicrobium mesophilum DSM 19309]|uniref:Malto-oligosyltrehalose trehalohydrolase n=1 Tax=Rubellimicrobium mesophilum DSM 19309 TaxID=442562 RepID=A0A017HU87_9RHOB|nr:alpha-amylase family glycosyl hydrolase [Rubellimicrobium mesophilum]EYD77718.1 Malto-oligosyltrehalose trehalohydrolase [Rubellimicrobium mesophilum DSM 19309]